MAQLREQLGRLPEPRGGRRQLHPLPTVLTIALAATLAGARGYLAISEYAARLTQPQLKRLRAYFDRRQQRFVAPSEPTCQWPIILTPFRPIKLTHLGRQKSALAFVLQSIALSSQHEDV